MSHIILYSVTYIIIHLSFRLAHHDMHGTCVQKPKSSNKYLLLTQVRRAANNKQDNATKVTPVMLMRRLRRPPPLTMRMKLSDVPKFYLKLSWARSIWGQMPISACENQIRLQMNTSWDRHRVGIESIWRLCCLLSVHLEGSDACRCRTLRSSQSLRTLAIATWGDFNILPVQNISIYHRVGLAFHFDSRTATFTPA